MAGELQTTLVRRHDGRAQHFPADVGVSLEPRHAFIGPIVHDAACLLGRSDLRHRPGPAGPGEVGTREMQPRPRCLAAIDRLLHVDLVVRRGAAGSAGGSDAVGEIKPRRGKLQLHTAAARRVERVVVHPDDAGNHGVAAEVHHARARGHDRACRRPHRHDLAALNQDGLIVERRLTRTVDDPYVLQRHPRFGNADHGLHGGRHRADALPGDDNRNDDRGSYQGKSLH